MNAKDMRTHVTILGWLNIASGILFLVVGAFVFLLLTGIGAVSVDAEAFVVLSIIGSFVGFIMLVLALPSIVAGAGLLKGKNWARILAIILAVFNLMNFPLGTAVGLYTFYVLFQNEANDYFTHALA